MMNRMVQAMYCSDLFEPGPGLRAKARGGRARGLCLLSLRRVGLDPGSDGYFMQKAHEPLPSGQP